MAHPASSQHRLRTFVVREPILIFAHITSLDLMQCSYSCTTNCTRTCKEQCAADIKVSQCCSSNLQMSTPKTNTLWIVQVQRGIQFKWLPENSNLTQINQLFWAGSNFLLYLPISQSNIPQLYAWLLKSETFSQKYIW